MLMNMQVHEFVNELASSSPAPGGGTIAAVSGAFGAGLAAMVCRLTIGNAKYPDSQEILPPVLEELDGHVARMVALADEDTEAFNQVMAAFRMPKETDEEKALRKTAIAAANLLATRIPMETATRTVEALEKMDTVIAYGNTNALSDCGVAVESLHTAVTGALMNVGINLPSVKDEEALEELTGQRDQLKKRLDTAVTGARKALAEKFVY